MAEELLTLAEAVPIAKRNISTLRAAVKRGDLPAVKKGKTWLVRPADLDKWLDNPEMHKPGLTKGQKIQRRGPGRPRKDETGSS